MSRHFVFELNLLIVLGLLIMGVRTGAIGTEKVHLTRAIKLPNDTYDDKGDDYVVFWYWAVSRLVSGKHYDKGKQGVFG